MDARPRESCVPRVRAHGLRAWALCVVHPRGVQIRATHDTRDHVLRLRIQQQRRVRHVREGARMLNSLLDRFIVWLLTVRWGRG